MRRSLTPDNIRIAHKQSLPTVIQAVEGGHFLQGQLERVEESGQQNARVGERTNQAWQDQTAGFYFVVVDAMLKTGFTPDEIGKIGGGNFLRVFGEAVKK